MKKAKLVLMAVAVFGIAGGVLAFKAQKFIAVPLYCAGSSQTDHCSLASDFTTILPGSDFSYTTTPSGGQFTSFCTEDVNAACAVSSIYTTTASE